MNRKIASLASIICLIALLSGISIAGERPAAGGPPDNAPLDRMEKRISFLKERLNLTDDQAVKIRAILEDEEKAMAAEHAVQMGDKDKPMVEQKVVMTEKEKQVGEQKAMIEQKEKQMTEQKAVMSEKDKELGDKKAMPRDKMAMVNSRDKIRKDTDAKIKAVLTPEQQTKYQNMMAEMHKNRPPRDEKQGMKKIAPENPSPGAPGADKK